MANIINNNSPRTKIAWFGLFVLILFLSSNSLDISLYTSGASDRQTVLPRCGINNEGGSSVVFNFEPQSISSGERSLPVNNFYLAPGNYRITLHSFDDHENDVNPETDETYFIRLNDEVGMIVETNSTSDISDNFSSVVGIVEKNIAISRSAKQMIAIHGSDSMDSSNDLFPICVAFTYIGPLTNSQ